MLERGLSMKQFSLVVILVSCFLGIVSHTANLVQLSVENVSIVNPFLNLYLRFGDLTLLMGFVGIYVISNKNKAIKAYSLSYVIVGAIQFLAIDFGLIPAFGPLFMIGVMLKVVIFMGVIFQCSDYEIRSLTAKGNILIIALGLYGVVSAVLLILSTMQLDSVSLIVGLSLSIIHIVFKICVGFFFLEIYKEIFVFDNKFLLE